MYAVKERKNKLQMSVKRIAKKHTERPLSPLVHERKEPRGAATAATVYGPRSLASGLAAGGDEERGSVSSTDRLSS